MIIWVLLVTNQTTRLIVFFWTEHKACHIYLDDKSTGFVIKSTCACCCYAFSCISTSSVNQQSPKLPNILTSSLLQAGTKVVLIVCRNFFIKFHKRTVTNRVCETMDEVRGGLRLDGVPGWNLERGPFLSIYEKLNEQIEVLVLLKQMKLGQKNESLTYAEITIWMKLMDLAKNILYVQMK